MQSKFAKAIAANIRTIAECSAQIAVIDGTKYPDGKPGFVYESRANLWDKVRKAEGNIAALLQQPGAKLDD